MPDGQKIGIGEVNINDAAARALMVLANTPRSGEQEFIGMLFQDPATREFFRTQLQTQGNQNTSTFEGFVPGDPAGIAHSHPFQQGAVPNTQFSRQDALTAQQFQEPMFVLAPQRNGDAPQQRKLNPPAPDATVPSSAETRGVEGEEFLAQFPTDLLFRLIARDSPVMRGLLDARKQNPRLPEIGPPRSKAGPK